jgi:iron complex outermembrane receptor protein
MKQVLFLFVITLTLSLQAQEKGAIGGKILDAELYNEPLLMASITLEGTALSAQTNFNGNFEIIDVVPGEYVMKISFLGYEDVALPITIHQNTTTFISHSLKGKTIPFIDIAETNSTASKEGLATSGL